jgi:hypothetical protein
MFPAYARRSHPHRATAASRNTSRPPARPTRPEGGPTIQRKAGCACGGGCPRCRAERERAEAGPGPSTPLRVSGPREEAEQEADRVAEVVMRTPATSAPAPAPATATAQEAGGAGTPWRGPGRPLPGSVRSSFEPRFGLDLGAVRIHDDSDAARSAREYGALAYTLGSHIVFGERQFAPGTAAGRRLLAHELAHVAQQADGRPRMIQRQFDPCIETPLGQVCGSDAKKVCEKFRSLPGCDQICALFDCEEPEEPPARCPPGFRAATSSGFRGQCCRGTIDSDRDCCPPERAAFADLRCCGEDEVVMDGRCVPRGDVPPLPPGVLCLPWQQTTLGECCTPPLVPQGAVCALPSTPPTPPVVPPPTPQAPSPVEVFFKLDRPRPAETSASSLGGSVTAEGQANFDALVAHLKVNPDLRVQLVGRASPEGDEDYNMKLGARRARLVKAALLDAGIPESQIVDPPTDELDPDCQRLGTGLASCGELNATGESDRQVLARLFLSG